MTLKRIAAAAILALFPLAAHATVPPVPDADRYANFALSTPTTVVGVPFAIYGDCTDISVVYNGTPMVLGSEWTCASASGVAMGLQSLPITDVQVTLSPSLSTGSLEIIGSWHPRNLTIPTAPGITRNEYEQSVNTLTSSLREVRRYLPPPPTVSGYVWTSQGAGYPAAWMPLSAFSVSGSTPFSYGMSMATAAFVAAADPTGATCSDAALTTALNVATAGVISEIKFPAGHYKFCSTHTISYTQSSTLVLRGAGLGVTEFLFTNAGDAFSVNFTQGNWLDAYGSGLEISGITFKTTQVKPGTAIRLNGQAIAGTPSSPVLLENLSFSGSSTTAEWTVGIYAVDTQNISGAHIFYYGSSLTFDTTAIGIDGTTNAHFPTQFNFSDLNVWFANYGVTASGWVQGLNISQSNFTVVNYGIVPALTANAPAGGSLGGGGQNQFSVTNTQFNCNIVCFDGSNVITSQITGNLITFGNAGGARGSTSGTGILCDMCDGLTISGNTFQGTSASVAGHPVDTAMSFTQSGPGPDDGTGAHNPVRNSSVITGNTISYAHYGIVFAANVVSYNSCGNSFGVYVDYTIVDNGVVGSNGTCEPKFYTPPLATTACQAGQFAMDTSYIYVCLYSGAWRRAAISSF
jgi:hypothetical protein